MKHIYLKTGKLLKIELHIFLCRLHAQNLDTCGSPSFVLTFCPGKGNGGVIAREFEDKMNHG